MKKTHWVVVSARFVGIIWLLAILIAFFSEGTELANRIWGFGFAFIISLIWGYAFVLWYFNKKKGHNS